MLPTFANYPPMQQRVALRETDLISDLREDLKCTRIMRRI